MLQTPLFWLSLLPFTLFGLGASSQSAESIDGPTAAKQLLVLHNGNILQGEIVRIGDHYQVIFPHGEMRVPARQVALCCGSLEEAYLEQRASRTGSTADSHVQLAKWCLRHKLLDYARRELEDARKSDSMSQGVRTLERQIAQATWAMKHSANGEKNKQKSPGVATPGLAPGDQFAADFTLIPKSARAQFVRQIEPLLMKNCATSGCHQPNSPQKFRLNRLAVIGSRHPGLTRQNLAAVLEQLDSESKDGAPLLSHATRAHGATPEAESIPLSLKKYRILRDWAELIASQKDQVQQPQPLAPADIKARLMKRWDKSWDVNVKDSVVIRRASAPIYHHPSQTVTIQRKESLPENMPTEKPLTEKPMSTEQVTE